MKKYVEISVNKKTVVIAEIKECEPLEFIQKKIEAKNNFEKMIKDFEDRIHNLEKEVKILKGEE